MTVITDTEKTGARQSRLRKQYGLDTSPPVSATGASSNLDFLRTIAVLLVVQAHLTGFFGVHSYWFFEPSLLGGLGVVLFFVHTSLVLMMSLERQEQLSEGRFLYFVFLIRRAFRIYPLSIVFCIFVYLTSIPQHLDVTNHCFSHIPITRVGFLANLLLLQNLVTGVSILDPLWSLPYEFHMYLILPFIYKLTRKNSSTLPLTAAWAAVALLAVIAAPRFEKYNATLSFFHFPDPVFFACFLPGIIAYKAREKQHPNLPFVGLPLIIIRHPRLVIELRQDPIYVWFTSCRIISPILPGA